VSSVSPVEGSAFGGTLLTITGENFCEASMLDNNVFISNGKENVMCNIKSATKTQLTCLTDPAHPDFTLGASLQVVVQGKLIEDSTCVGVCAFSYKS